MNQNINYIQSNSMNNITHNFDPLETQKPNLYAVKMFHEVFWSYLLIFFEKFHIHKKIYFVNTHDYFSSSFVSILNKFKLFRNMSKMN